MSKKLTSENEILVGDPNNPDVIVRMFNGKYRVFGRPGLKLTERPATRQMPSVRDPIHVSPNRSTS